MTTCVHCNRVIHELCSGKITVAEARAFWAAHLAQITSTDSTEQESER